MKIFKPAFLFINIPVNCQKIQRTSVGIEFMITVFPHVRPAGIIISHSLQMQVLLENTTFLLHKIVRIQIAGIIRVASIIRERALFEEIR